MSLLVRICLRRSLTALLCIGLLGFSSCKRKFNKQRSHALTGGVIVDGSGNVTTNAQSAPRPAGGANADPFSGLFATPPRKSAGSANRRGPAPGSAAKQRAAKPINPFGTSVPLGGAAARKATNPFN